MNHLSSDWASDRPGVYEGGVDGVDFVLNIPAGHDIGILQLSDPQVCSPAKARNATRVWQLTDAYYRDGVFGFEEKVGGYIRQLLENCTPDLIVLAGDIVYGETDDSGEDLLAFIDFMDSFKIPWAACWGNHDNESAKGVRWQCEQLMKSEYGVFKPGSVTGHSNYNIVLRQNGEIRYTLFFVDTNGCMKLGCPGEGVQPENVDYDLLPRAYGIFPDQIEWFRDANAKIRALAGRDVPNLVFQHVNLSAVCAALEAKYPAEAAARTPVHGKGEDFGALTRGWGQVLDVDNAFFDACRANNTTGIFFGHEHTNDLSIVWKGVRLTFGSKTGTHNSYIPDMLGGTLVFLDEKTNELTVRHIKNVDLPPLGTRK